MIVVGNGAVVFVEIVDFNVSVELKRHPEASGLPVVVGTSADPGARGAVVESASREARSIGISAGMPLARAARMAEDAVFIAADYERRDAESAAFMELLREYPARIESYSPGSAFMEFAPEAGRDRFDDAAEVAGEIVEGIRRRLGLKAVAGVGDSKFTAMAALRVAGGDAGPVSVMRPSGARGMLGGLVVGRVPGVDGRTAERLGVLGARTLSDVAAMQVRHLEANFGHRMGRMLFDRAKGVDASPVVPFYEAGAVVREVTLDEPTSDAAVVREVLYALSEDVAARLKSARAKCSVVSVKAGLSDLRTTVVGHAFDEPTDSMNDIWGVVKTLAAGLDISGRVRSVGVMASDVKGRSTGS